MTDVNRHREVWHVVVSDGCIEVVADFPVVDSLLEPDGMRITGWIVTRGQDEPSVLANIVNGANAYGCGSYLDVPLLQGLDESVSVEEIRIRLAAYGY